MEAYQEKLKILHLAFFYIFVVRIYFDTFYKDKFMVNGQCVFQTRKVYSERGVSYKYGNH